MASKVKPLPAEFNDAQSRFSETKVQKERQTRRRSSEPRQTPEVIPFGKKNFLFFGVSCAVLVLGYYILSIDEFVDARQFSLSLNVAPPIIVAGYALMIYAIMVKSPDVEAEIAQVQAGSASRETATPDSEL